MEYRVSAEHNIYPNITVEEGYYESAPDTTLRYRVTPNVGYVFYDTTERNYELDPETGLEREVTHYYRLAYLTRNYNFDNFSFVAVPESEVPADHIFGGGSNNKPEIM